LTSQLIRHETDSKKWWEDPVGFNYLVEGVEDEDPFQYAPSEPPPGWQRLPMHEEN